MSCSLLKKIFKVHKSDRRWTVEANEEDFLQIDKRSRRLVYNLLIAFLIAAGSIVFEFDDSPLFGEEPTKEIDDDDEDNFLDADWYFMSLKRFQRGVFNRDVLDTSLLAMIAILYALVMMGFRPAKRLVESKWGLGTKEQEKLTENEEQVDASLSIYRRVYACFSVCLFTFALVRIEGTVHHYDAYSNPEIITILQSILLLLLAEVFFWMNMALFLSPQANREIASMEASDDLEQRKDGLVGEQIA